MADQKPTDNYFENLGGINIKASSYSTGKYQFLALYNFDFDVPNALQKRPGSTFAVSAGTSGPITSLFEFIRLDGVSYVVAASDTALFYITGSQYTLLSPGWNNGQPPDMLTFLNRLWAANGDKYQSWGGSAAVPPVQSGLPAQVAPIVPVTDQFNGATFWLVGGATMQTGPSGIGASFTLRGVYLAYSYLRNDGYVGPANFQQDARNILMARPNVNGSEYFNDLPATQFAGGLTIPSGLGISAIQLWVAVDTVTHLSGTYYLGPTLGTVQVGNIGWYDKQGGTSSRRMSYTVLPTADVTRFHLFTTIPGSLLFTAAVSSFVSGTASVYGASFRLPASTGFNDFDSVAAGDGFSGMQFNFYSTYTPKYIEVNQNIMFMAGFSAAPSTVWFSEVGQPEFIQPDYNFEVRTNDGDRVLALKEFQNQLIVFKETSFHKLIGNSADNFELVQISNEYGCVSNRCAVTFGNDLAFLDRKGIVRYNGASWEVISTPIEAIFRRMNLAAAKEKACGVNHIYRNQIWFGIPVDGSTENNLTVVYDYLVDAWTYFDGFNAASFTYAKGQLSIPTSWRGDYSGLVHYTGQSFFSDSGRAITCLAQTHFENFGGQNETSIWRRFFLDVAPASGLTGQIKGQVFSNYDSVTTQATFSVYQNVFQTRAEMGVIGKAMAAQLSHSSASLPLLINGYAWTKRPLRNV